MQRHHPDLGCQFNLKDYDEERPIKQKNKDGTEKVVKLRLSKCKTHRILVCGAFDFDTYEFCGRIYGSHFNEDTWT